MTAQLPRAPRSSARIDPVARLIFDIAKPLLRPDPAPQHQPTPRSMTDLAMRLRRARAG